MAIYALEDDHREAYSLINLPSEGKFIYIKRDRNVLDQYSQAFEFYIELTDAVDLFNNEAWSLQNDITKALNELPRQLMDIIPAVPRSILMKSEDIGDKIHNTLGNIKVNDVYKAEKASNIRNILYNTHNDVEDLKKLLESEDMRAKNIPAVQDIVKYLDEIITSFSARIETILSKKNRRK